MYFLEAARLIQAPLLNPDISLTIRGASIDTRTLLPGNLFVALPGSTVDGHQYLDRAFEKGASGAIVSDAFIRPQDLTLKKWKNLLSVEDPAKAFLALAGYYRLQIQPPVSIGIAGSVGKTSTKEFLAYLLSHRAPTLFTEGNLNNHLGLPLTLFRLNPQHHYCVCELGANKVGDVKDLAAVLRPDAAVLTRIAPEHLEGFGSMEGVYRAEFEIFEALKPGSVAVLPDDDPILFKMSQSLKLQFVRVGMNPAADYRVTEIRIQEGRVVFNVNGVSYSFPGAAGFLARNAAMAIALADRSGFPMMDQPKDWQDFKLPPGRFQIETTASGLQIIFDGYNASPASFDAAIQSFDEITGTGRKFLVFSDMLEMGSAERAFHESLGARIAASGISAAVAYGPRSRWTVDKIRNENPDFDVTYVENAKEAGAYLASVLQKQDMLLLKASRGMKIEDVLDGLGEAQPCPHP